MLLRAILVLMLGLIAAVPSPAFADDGYFAGGVGQAPVPRNSKDIVMESEVVNIVLHEGFAEVECAYKFRNDGNDQTVIMGFPDPTDPAKDLGISIFKVFVDDIEVPVKETTITLKPDQPGFEQYGPISRWYLHDISFKKDETKVVVNRYVAPHGVSASPETASFRHFSYILRTGATWKGVIGRAVINVSFASGLSWSNFKPDPESYKETGGAPSSDLYIRPSGYQKKPDGFFWSFKSIEPKDTEDDILIGFFRNLKKTGPRTLRASASSWLNAGAYKYPAIQAFDDDVNTAWAEGAPGSGIGESVKVAFNEPKQIAEVRILPGYTKKNELFAKYGRPRKATIQFSDETRKRILLDDDPRVQYFPLDKPIRATWAKLTIDDVYKGSVGEDTYISEVEFGPTQTRHIAKATEQLSKMIPTGAISSSSTTIAHETKRTLNDRSKRAVASREEKRDSSRKAFIGSIVVLTLGIIAAVAVIVNKFVRHRKA